MKTLFYLWDMNGTQPPNTMQRLEGVTAQEMFNTLDAYGYAIPFDVKKMSPWQRWELERQYIQHIGRNV